MSSPLYNYFSLKTLVTLLINYFQNFKLTLCNLELGFGPPTCCLLVELLGFGSLTCCLLVELLGFGALMCCLLVERVCGCFREDGSCVCFRGFFDRLRPARGLKLCRGLIIQLLLGTHQLRR
jgi:hypothetical protein